MDRTIIITGTSRGLGLAIYNKLAQNSYNIATISRSAETLETENLLQFAGDITDYWDRKHFIDKVIKKYEQIDVLINNAGIVIISPFLEYTEFDYHNIFDVNVGGTFGLTQLVIKQMLKQETGGNIINIGSIRAITGAPNKSLYSMSKFALRSMTQCINEEFKNRNIASTIICPGQLDTITEEVVNTIEFLIKNNIRIVPEIIIGGQL
jgi:short-subunit dehydrogenase